MYLKDDGCYARDEWIYDNGSWYFIKHSGNMDRGVVSSTYEKTGGLYYCFDRSGKLATGGFVDGGYDIYFADKKGHPIDGLFMVDDVLYRAYNMQIFANSNYPASLSNYINVKTTITIDCFFDHGKVLDKDKKNFAANSKLYTDIKYLPKYDSKGNLIGEIKNENGHIFKLYGTNKGTGPLLSIRQR